MPKILEAAVKRIKAKGASISSAYAMATSTLQKAGELRKGSNKPTAKGLKRGQMTQAQRHKHPV